MENILADILTDSTWKVSTKSPSQLPPGGQVLRLPSLQKYLESSPAKQVGTGLAADWTWVLTLHCL